MTQFCVRARRAAGEAVRAVYPRGGGCYFDVNDAYVRALGAATDSLLATADEEGVGLGANWTEGAAHAVAELVVEEESRFHRPGPPAIDDDHFSVYNISGVF